LKELPGTYLKKLGNMSNPIICFDLDGTLFDPQGRIHPRDIAILTSESEINFIIATGRSLQSVHAMFTKNGLFTDVFIPFPLVLQNGSVIYEENEKLAGYFPFTHDTQHQLIEIIQITFYLFEVKETHLLWPTAFGLDTAERFGMQSKPYKTDGGNFNYSKITCVSEDNDLMQKFAQIIQYLEVEISFSMETLLEITPQGIDKGSGLGQLLSLLNKSTVNLFFAGDGENDLPLFDTAQYSFAPANSPEPVRVCADDIIDTGKRGLLTPMLEKAGYL
jgi:Cof subfamily protein (haloacid dehalogenase superfamily)